MMIETLRPAPFIFAVHDYITRVRFGEWLSVKALCEHFFPEQGHTPSNDTAMRNAVAEVCKSDLFHSIIVSTHKGFKVCETQDEYIRYRASMLETFNAILDRIHAVEYKAKHDDFARLPLGENDETIYKAIKKKRPTVTRKAKPEEPDIVFVIGENGQYQLPIGGK